MNRPSFSAVLDTIAEPVLTLGALTLLLFSVSSSAAVLAWTAGALDPGTLVPGTLVPATPSQPLALAGFALGFGALLAAYGVLSHVLSRQPQPPFDPY